MYSKSLLFLLYSTGRRGVGQMLLVSAVSEGTVKLNLLRNFLKLNSCLLAALCLFFCEKSPLHFLWKFEHYLEILSFRSTEYT